MSGIAKACITDDAGALQQPATAALTAVVLQHHNQRLDCRLCVQHGIPHAVTTSKGGPMAAVSVPHVCSITLTALEPWLTPVHTVHQAAGPAMLSSSVGAISASMREKAEHARSESLHVRASVFKDLAAPSGRRGEQPTSGQGRAQVRPSQFAAQLVRSSGRLGRRSVAVTHPPSSAMTMPAAHARRQVGHLARTAAHGGAST